MTSIRLWAIAYVTTETALMSMATVPALTGVPPLSVAATLALGDDRARGDPNRKLASRDDFALFGS